MSYRVEFTPSAARAFKKLPGSIQSRIAPKIDALAAIPRPHGVEKMAGHENRYRVRVGEYRVIYVISDGPRLITVAVIGHRREVYR
ncbi:MAG TPA: type II toxin-antitoxin system RelE/ParE family toxin [Elusimicrobiota bacterium]|nr:type II toxin-antitoxin system RelE/ParE family toxin [Elusimicrobiota bacterium]